VEKMEKACAVIRVGGKRHTTSLAGGGEKRMKKGREKLVSALSTMHAYV